METAGWVDAWGLEEEELKGELLVREAEISRLRSEQVALLRKADRLQIDTADGSRTMIDWVSAHLDVSHQTARRMMQVARAAHPDIEAGMRGGAYGVDRAALLCRLRELDGPEEVIGDSSDYSLGHLFGLVDRLRRLDGTCERFSFEDRYLVIQPDLEASSYRLWGQLPGADGMVVEQALNRRETELPSLPDQTQGQRRVDALTSICLDSLTARQADHQDRAVTVAEVFVEAARAAPSHGEVGVSLSSGPRLGPNTLTEILCSGKVRVIVCGDDGRPIGVSDRGEAIPPAVRSYVLYRDQGRCAIDGCRSRYRLQPHHVTERASGGDHHPDNLITLCWYHHHVAVHMLGMTLDPHSPRHRRRLMGPPNHGPPNFPLSVKMSV